MAGGDGESDSSAAGGGGRVDVGEDLVGILREMTRTLRAQPQYSQVGVDSKPMAALREFKHQKPPVFKGDSNPIVVEEWLEEITKILDALRILEDYSRITPATYQLTGEAAQWWKMVKRSTNVEEMTWDQFCKLFLDKYFPIVLQEAKVQEFIKLYQGTKSVMEYNARFTELSRYAPEIVADEHKKSRKFEQGLRPSIRSQVSLLRLPTYVEVLERALLAESEGEEVKKIRERARPRGGQQSGNPSKSQRTSSSSYRSFSARQSQQQSRSGVPVCYQCGQPGHVRRVCPQGEGSRSVTGPPKATDSAPRRWSTLAQLLVFMETCS